MVQLLATAITLPPSKHALLFPLLGLIAGFGGARTVVRLSHASDGRRFRSARNGDVHVHHVVYDVVALSASGVLAFALGNDSDWNSARPGRTGSIAATPTSSNGRGDVRRSSALGATGYGTSSLARRRLDRGSA